MGLELGPQSALRSWGGCVLFVGLWSSRAQRGLLLQYFLDLPKVLPKMCLCEGWGVPVDFPLNQTQKGALRVRQTWLRLGSPESAESHLKPKRIDLLAFWFLLVPYLVKVPQGDHLLFPGPLGKSGV